MASKTETRPIPYRIATLAAVLIMLLLLTGCTKKYTFNFKTERDAVNSEGAWFEDDQIEYTSLGAYLDDDALVSPFRFGGDFTAEIDFYLNTSDEHYLQWLEFYLIDSDNWDYDAWIGAGMNLSSPTAGSYWVGQRNSAPGGSGPLPGLIADGHNKMTISKTGDSVSVTLGSHAFPSFLILPENVSGYYNLMLEGYDDGNTLGKGLYIEKVVVTYQDGNRVSVTP